MKFDEKAIELKLCNIFKEITGKDFSNNNDLKNAKLLGNKIKSSPRELVLLFYEIEAAFNISIPGQVVLMGRFDSYNNILRFVFHNVL